MADKKYHFYIQRYPEGTTKFNAVDIESYFSCLYVRLEGANLPEVKNVYEEEFPEKSGSNIWLPDEVAYKSSDLTLELLFKSNVDYQVLQDEKSFLDYITGKKFEYHDTFRPNRYWQLTFTSTPELKSEKIHGDQQYRHVAFKLRNWGGKYYTTSQIS